MKKLNEGGDWEKEWADAFEHASLQPSDNVWNAIDGSLANKDLRKYKKRAAFFQWVAAASVLLSICGVAWQLTQPDGSEFSQQLARQQQQQQQQEVQQPASNTVPLFAEEGSVSEKSREQTAKKSSSENSAQSSLADASVIENNSGLIANEKEEESFSSIGIVGTITRDNSKPASFKRIGIGSKRTATGLIAQAEEAIAGGGATNNVEDKNPKGIKDAEKAGFIFFKQSVAAVEADFRKVWLASDLFSAKEEVSDARFWLGATLTSGSFDPNFQQNSTSLAHLAQSDSEPVKGGLLPTARVSQWNEEPQPQISVNGGVQAAAWIGKKWVLQGGVQYGSYRSGTTAGTFVDQNGSQAYPLHYANFSSDKVQLARAGSRLTAPVAALNTFEFISVPLQLGYVVFDRKFSLVVAPGISSEFFLRNQLSDQNNRLSTYTIYSGEGAPFETVHFKGVLGAQLFYKLNDNYMISLEPSYQQAITNFSKSSSFFESRPSNVGISAGFRYIIR
jgi:hypothetical protein